MPDPIEKEVQVDAPRKRVWEFLISHKRKAAAIDEVKDVKVKDGRAEWRVRIPLPVIGRYVRVRTRELRREPPHLVRFEARAPFVKLTGEHELEPLGDERCSVMNRFWIRSRVPGIESAFRRQLERQLPRLMSALKR